MKKILQLLTLATLLAASLSAAPIHVAAGCGDLAWVQRLIAEDSECVNAKDMINWTPLHAAARYGHTIIAEFLIKHGAVVDSKSIHGATPLYLAASFDHTTTVELLIDRGANVHAQSDAGNTPLHGAACDGNMTTVELLIERGADANAKNNSGDTPLHRAILYGHAETAKIIKTLILNKMLWNAVCRKNLKVANLALSKGASPNAAAAGWMLSKKEDTPADISSRLRDASIRKDTPLHIAIEGGSAEMVRLLIAFGGEIDRPNNSKEGTTPFDLAVFHLAEGNAEILAVIHEVSKSKTSSWLSGLFNLLPARFTSAFGQS